MEAMQALRDAVRAHPPQQNAFKKLLQALDQNMTLESASEISEVERIHLLEGMLQLVPDFAQQMELHWENPRSETTYVSLKGR